MISNRLNGALVAALSFFLWIASAHASIELALDVNPAPVKPGETVNVTVSVGNNGPSTSGVITLRFTYPNGALFLANELISDGGTCPGTGCEFNGGETVTWNLGNLTAGTSRSVTLPPTIWANVSAGTSIPFTVQVLENGVSQAQATKTLLTQSNPAFGIAVDEDANPVAPGDTLTYTLSFSNRGTVNATQTSLRFPIPSGTTFASATGGGSSAGGVVTWNLGTLQALSGGEQKVTVTVNSATPRGSLLRVDAAEIEGLVSSLSQLSSAMTVTRVESTPPIRLGMELNPDPVVPGETVNAALTVSNISNATLSGVTLRLRYPDGALFLFNTLISDAGTCPGSGCEFDGDEFVTWSLGNLSAGASRTVTIPPTLWANVPAGQLITFNAELVEDTGRRIAESKTLRTQSNPAFGIAVDEDANPVAPGDTLTYTLSFSNRGTVNATQTSLRFPIPSGTTFVSATSGGSSAGGVVTWNLGTLQALSGGEQKVTVTVNNTTPRGSLLKVDAAQIDGLVSSLPQMSSAMAVTRVETTPPIRLGIELNPDPVVPGETVNTALTVSNITNSALSGVTLRLRYPDGALFLFNTLISDAGTCPGSGCEFDGDEFVTWSLGNLAPGASRTVTIPPTLWASVPAGQLITFNAELVEDTGRRIAESKTLRTQSSPAFSIAVDESANPVLPGDSLLYTISYSNRGAVNATQTNLRFPIPIGTTFSAATAGGALSGGAVTWPIGTLLARNGGEHKVRVFVNTNVVPGSILEVDAAEINGLINSLPDTSSAMSLTRVVASTPIVLTSSVTPRIIAPGGTVTAALTARNVSFNSLTGVTYRLRYPDGPLFLNNPLISDGGTCPGGGCDFDSDELVTWNLGNLASGVTRSVSLPPTIWASVPAGTLITFNSEIDEDTAGAAESSSTLFVGTATNFVTRPDPSSCSGDFDGDRDVDGQDLTKFNAAFGRTNCSVTTPCNGDFDNDGDVDGADLTKFNSSFGRTNCL